MHDFRGAMLHMLLAAIRIAGAHATAPLRSSSLPSMDIPAGHSHKLGNYLGLEAYSSTKLRGCFVARGEPLKRRFRFYGEVETWRCIPRTLEPPQLRRARCTSGPFVCHGSMNMRYNYTHKITYHYTIYIIYNSHIYIMIKLVR